MQRVRHSKQRDAIKAYLLSTTSHPTAEAVYEQLQNDFPNISLGTVYRNLNFLVDHGEALRLDMEMATTTSTAMLCLTTISSAASATMF